MLCSIKRFLTKPTTRSTLVLSSLLISVAIHSAHSQEPLTYLLDNSNFTEYLNATNVINDTTYELIGNITLTGTQIPIGSREDALSLTLDGGGYSISGLDVTTDENNTPAGLFGYLVNSRVNNLFLNEPTVLSRGKASPAGAVVGEMDNSTVTDVTNHNGRVTTDGGVTGSFSTGFRYSSAGGLVGWARDRSRVENTLNTGMVRTISDDSPAGGAVGIASRNSLVSGNLNTGAVRTDRISGSAGGAVGWASGSEVSGNLNTGTIRSYGTYGYTGGAVGWAYDNSMVSGNLNTGSVRTSGGSAHAGGVVGVAYINSPVSGNLNTGSVRTDRPDTDTGGAVGHAYINSPVSNNLNTGSIRANGANSYAGGAAGYAHGNSPVSSNLNTGSVSTIKQVAYAGGAVGLTYGNSVVSGNLNTGSVSTIKQDAHAGGAVGRAYYNSVVSGNLNTGSVSTTEQDAHAGGAVGLTYDNSMISGNLNTGSVSTIKQDAHAGGAVGFTYDDSMVSGNLNTGSVSTIEQDAHAGGAVGLADNSPVSDNLNTGSVSTIEQDAYAGGAVGLANNATVSDNLNTGSVSTIEENAYAGGAVGLANNSTVSGNLNNGTIDAQHSNSTEGSQTGNPVDNNALPVPINNLGELNGMLWTAGNDGEFPILIDINAAYQDLKRINGTLPQYGNNTFPIAFDDFAQPDNDRSESLFNPKIWNLREGYLPFLKSVGQARAQEVGIDCSKGAFACDCGSETDDFCVEATTEAVTTEAATEAITTNEDTTSTVAITAKAATEPITISDVTTEPTTNSTCPCPFTTQTPGTIEHLLYDGQHYHAVVKTDGDLAYWATYEKDGSRVSLESCCDVYSFSDLNDGGGVVVDAVANNGDKFHVAYHAQDQSDSWLARYEVSDSGLQLLMSMMPLSTHPVDLFVYDEAFLYLVSADQIQLDGMPVFSAMDGETIQSALIVEDTLYVLLDSAEGLQVKAANLNGELDTNFMVIPVAVAEGQVVALQVGALQVGNQKIHLLVQENNQVRWLTYNLQGEKQSESLARIADSVTLKHLDLVLESITGTPAFQEQVIAMGANSENQPWWSAISFESVQPIDSTESHGLSTEVWAGISAAGVTTVILTTVGLVGLVYYLRHRTRISKYSGSAIGLINVSYAQ